ncbi:MAG: alanine racemase [Chlorobi bacterium]|nr:alanine racemase [Chlorobiota bacterium]
MRATFAEINIGAIKRNLSAIRSLSGSAELMVLVKANAYGHGIVEMARILRQNDVKFLGCAFTEEAVELRESGDRGDILVLVPPHISVAADIVKHDLHIMISSLEFVTVLNNEAAKQGKTVKAHINIDTGMTRDGFSISELSDLTVQLSKLKNIEYVGVCSHFATSPTDLNYADEQLQKFNKSVDLLENANFKFKYIHISNSGGIANIPEARFNLVRAGIALYGYAPSPATERNLKVEPIMTLRSEVVWSKKIKAGQSVGYDRLFVAKQDTRIVTVPIGYGDGFTKANQTKAEVLIRGRRFPIVGSICMDECMVDVGDAEIEIGEKVVLIGTQGSETISATDIADKINTISYEITTNLSMRVRRVYI